MSRIYYWILINSSQSSQKMMSSFFHTLLYCFVHSDGKGITEHTYYTRVGTGAGWLVGRFKGNS